MILNMPQHNYGTFYMVNDLRVPEHGQAKFQQVLTLATYRMVVHHSSLFLVLVFTIWLFKISMENPHF